MQTKAFTLALLGILALIIGLVAGALSALAHVHPALCVAAGGGAFASTVLVGVAVWSVLK